MVDTQFGIYRMNVAVGLNKARAYPVSRRHTCVRARYQR